MPITVEQATAELRRRRASEELNRRRQGRNEFLEDAYQDPEMLKGFMPVDEERSLNRLLEATGKQPEEITDVMYFAEQFGQTPDVIRPYMEGIIKHTGGFVPSKATPQERGIFSKIAESWRRGDAEIAHDIAAYEALFEGRGKYEDVRKLRKKLQAKEAFDPIESNFFGDMVYGSARILPGMVKGYWSAIDEAFKGMAIGAGMALAAGQVPPLTLVPEEIVGVPGGALVGSKAGLMIGASMFWYKQGAGSMASTMIEKGYDPEVSLEIAGIAAIPYAMVEMLQVSQLTPGLRRSMLKTTTKRTLAVMGRVAAKYGGTLTKEVLEEVVQEIIQIGAEDISGALSTVGIKVDADYFAQRGARVWETLKESGKAMALLPLPGAAIDMRTGLRNIKEIAPEAAIEAKVEAEVAKAPEIKALSDKDLKKKILSVPPTSPEWVAAFQEMKRRKVEAEKPPEKAPEAPLKAPTAAPVAKVLPEPAKAPAEAERVVPEKLIKKYAKGDTVLATDGTRILTSKATEADLRFSIDYFAKQLNERLKAKPDLPIDEQAKLLGMKRRAQEALAQPPAVAEGEAKVEVKPTEVAPTEGEQQLIEKARKHKTLESFREELKEDVSEKFGIKEPTKEAIEGHFESLQKGIRGGAAIELAEDSAQKGMTADKAPQNILDKTFPEGEVPERITVFRSQLTKRPLVSGDFISLSERVASSFGTGDVQSFEIKPENLVLTNKPTESLYFDPSKPPSDIKVLTIEEFFEKAKPEAKVEVPAEKPIQKLIKVEKEIVPKISKEKFTPSEVRKETKAEIPDSDSETQNAANLLEGYWREYDERELEINVAATKNQEAITKTLNKKQYLPESDIETSKMSQAMMLYIDLKEHPSGHQFAKKLSKLQKDIYELSKNLPANIRRIADSIIEQNRKAGALAVEKDVIANARENYIAHIWQKPTRKEVLRARFRQTTARAKKRTLEGGIMEGWSKGLKLRVDDVTLATQIAQSQINQAIVGREMLKLGKKWGLLSHKQPEGWVRVEHPGFTIWKWSGKAEKAKTYGRNFFVTEEGDLMERVPVYAEPELGKKLNNVFSPSALYKVPGIETISRYNAQIKSTILFTSLYHHQAFLRSYAFGSRGLNPKLAYEKGRQSIMNMTPEVRLLVRNGLTIGRIQDYDPRMIEGEQTIWGRALSHTKPTEAARKKLVALRKRQERFLFNKLGPALKIQAGILELKAELKRNQTELESGKITADEIAIAVADLVNNDFGGLHLGRMGRSQTAQHIFRLLALAPDWTESNIRSAVGAFKKGETGYLHRIFWGRIAIKGLGATILFNLLLSAFDDDDFAERYKKAWETGRLRWLDIDVTPIFRALGGSDDKRKYFSLLGHFRDPIKFTVHPFVSAKHKGSVVSRVMMDMMIGEDWAGREFTTLGELTGLTERGKLSGRLVKYSRGGARPIEPAQVPSYALYQVRSAMPIPIQNLIAFLGGEMDAFDAITKSAGLMTATTYPKKGSSKGERAKVQRVK